MPFNTFFPLCRKWGHKLFLPHSLSVCNWGQGWAQGSGVTVEMKWTDGSKAEGAWLKNNNIRTLGYYHWYMWLASRVNRCVFFSLVLIFFFFIFPALECLAFSAQVTEQGVCLWNRVKIQWSPCHLSIISNVCVAQCLSVWSDLPQLCSMCHGQSVVLPLSTGQALERVSNAPWTEHMCSGDEWSHSLVPAMHCELSYSGRWSLLYGCPFQGLTVRYLKASS